MSASRWLNIALAPSPSRSTKIPGNGYRDYTLTTVSFDTPKLETENRSKGGFLAKNHCAILWRR